MPISRSFVYQVAHLPPASPLLLKGWVSRLRILSKTTFLVLKDCSGEVQCVVATDFLTQAKVSLKLDDVVEVRGVIRMDARARLGCEVDIVSLTVLNPAAHDLPFHAADDLSRATPEVLLQHRSLSLRNEGVGDVFRLQAALVQLFREFLLHSDRRFTEIFSSKIVAGGTEGGANLFELRYFEKTAYLAQSPQFFKEQGVGGLERVFETGHVYRAEPHATTRHLTEYYSLDLEMGFIEGPEEVIQLEKELLSFIFDQLQTRYSSLFERHRWSPLPSLLSVPTWDFIECLTRLEKAYGRVDLKEDLDPLAEKQLCHLAEEECGVPAVFVLGFPLAYRPFYTHPRGEAGAAQSFDLLFRGLEITTGGQRLHSRTALEAALRSRGMDPSCFASHLRMFDLGMPPHGGLAIGAERLTAQIAGLPSVKLATLYPRDREHLSP